MVSLKTLPDEELKSMIATTADYLKKLENEQERRETIANVDESINDLNERYFQALGLKEQQPWEGPSSGLEAYPRDWEVTHVGGVWKSRQPGNIEEPGEGEAWERIGDDPNTPRYPGEDVLPGEDVYLFGHAEDEEEEDDMDGIDDLPVEDDAGPPGEDDA